MSSAAAADGTNASRGPIATASFGGGTNSTTATSSSRQASTTTFWCHECDMSVTLLFSSPPLVCPQCRGDFLEEMEQLEHPRPHSQTLTLLHSDHHRDVDGDDFDDLIYFPNPNDPSTNRFAPPSEDYNEVFDRLIGHLVSSDDLDDPTLTDPLGGGPWPASKSSVEAIPTIQISATFLASDPFLLCAVCKDEFALDSEARQLPCSHIYHPDCILPWLSQHNSCPVCRFRFPTDNQGRRRRSGREDRAPVVFGNLLQEDGVEEVEQDVRELGSMLSHIVRRHRSVFPGRSPGPSMADTDAVAEVEGDVLDIGDMLTRISRRRRLLVQRRSSRLSTVDVNAVSPAQMPQEAEMVSEGPANSAETVSSGWPLDEGTSVGGGGGSGSGRANDEGDVVMSEVRGSPYD